MKWIPSVGPPLNWILGRLHLSLQSSYHGERLLLMLPLWACGQRLVLSIMFTALSVSAPVVPLRHTAIGVPGGPPHGVFQYLSQFWTDLLANKMDKLSQRKIIPDVFDGIIVEYFIPRDEMVPHEPSADLRDTYSGSLFPTSDAKRLRTDFCCA